MYIHVYIRNIHTGKNLQICMWCGWAFCEQNPVSHGFGISTRSGFKHCGGSQWLTKQRHQKSCHINDCKTMQNDRSLTNYVNHLLYLIEVTIYAIGFFLGHLHNVLLPHVRPKCLELSLHLCRWGLPIATNKNQETKIENYIRKNLGWRGVALGKLD